MLPYWFAWLAMWVPNIVVGLWGLVLIVRKLRAPEQSSMKLALAVRAPARAQLGAVQDGAASSAKGTRVVVVIKIPHIAFPRPSILDWYVLKQGLRVSVLAGSGLLALFYIASFIDLSDHLFKGRTSAFTVLTYLWWASPQFTYYLVPLAVLMGALVTIGALTKNTELVVMKACGISLYRAAAPLLILAIIGSAILLGLEEGVLAVSNRRADAINNAHSRAISDGDRSESALGDGEQRQRLSVPVFRARPESAERPVDLRVRQGSLDARAPQIFLVRDVQGRSGSQGPGDLWQGSERLGARLRAEVPVRVVHEQADCDGRPGIFRQRAARCAVHVLSPAQRSRRRRSAAGGFNVVPYVVALHRKLAFPFVTLIMALIAVPFAVTTGKRGAMYGIGAGIVLAILYWTAISVFGAIGAGGSDGPRARRMGAEHHLRLRGDVPAADGADVNGPTDVDRASTTASSLDAQIFDREAPLRARQRVGRVDDEQQRVGECGIERRP